MENDQVIKILEQIHKEHSNFITFCIAIPISNNTLIASIFFSLMHLQKIDIYSLIDAIIFPAIFLIANIKTLLNLWN